jgi:hypothetical protein
MQLGVALHEALLNAMYHGNLEVSSELRADGETAFLAAAEERRRNCGLTGTAVSSSRRA